MKWELVIVWSDGSKNIYEYDEEGEAKRGGENMRFALGEQIEWWCVRPQNS